MFCKYLVISSIFILYFIQQLITIKFAILHQLLFIGIPGIPITFLKFKKVSKEKKNHQQVNIAWLLLALYTFLFNV